MTSVFRDALPSTALRPIRSLALAFSPDATPRLTMLSKRDRRGLAPNSSYELGRGRRRELAPSTSLWNRPRGGSGRVDPLPTSKVEREPAPEAETVPVLVPRSLDEVRSTESDCEGEGAFNELGEGAYSPDTARGNGMATNGSASSSLFAPSSRLLRLGMYIPFLCPAIPLRVLFRRGTTRLDDARLEPSVPGSGLVSRSRRSLGVSPGVSTLWRARCVGRRVGRGDNCDSMLGDGEAEVDKGPRSAKANSSWPLGDASTDADRDVREGFLIVIGREGT
jgi:hypothetical protein